MCHDFYFIAAVSIQHEVDGSAKRRNSSNSSEANETLDLDWWKLDIGKEGYLE